MFGLGITEIMVILVVALIVLGPEKLPEVARKLGRMSYQLRGAIDEIKHEINLSDDSPFEPEKPRQNALLISSKIADPNFASKDCCGDKDSPKDSPSGENLSSDNPVEKTEDKKD